MEEKLNLIRGEAHSEEHRSPKPADAGSNPASPAKNYEGSSPSAPAISKKVKHIFTWKSKYSGTCGDNYCPGHYHASVKCSCGWKKTFTYEVDVSDKEKLLLEHRLDYLESH